MRDTTSVMNDGRGIGAPLPGMQQTVNRFAEIRVAKGLVEHLSDACGVGLLAEIVRDEPREQHHRKAGAQCADFPSHVDSEAPAML